MKVRLFCFTVLGLALIACGGIDGVLKVQQAFQLKDRHGQTFAIPTGSHKVNLKYKDSKHRLTVTVKDLNEGEDSTIEIKTPDSFNLPENGSFQLRAEEYGQSVDLAGNISTQVTQSPERWGKESCQRQDYETICGPTPSGHTACYQRPVSRPGWMDVRYVDVTTQQDLSAGFTNPSTAAAVANLEAHTNYTERHVISQGPCW